MSTKWIKIGLALAACVGPLPSAFGRGGSSRNITRRIQQTQQQMQKQQAQIAAQQKAEIEAAEKKRHELHEASAAANREIRQHEKERGDRERQRASESATATRSKVPSAP